MTYRILHFIDTLGAGGAERQLVYLLTQLDRKRFESHVVTTYDTFRHYESTLRAMSIPLHSLHHGELNTWSRMKAMGRYASLLWRLRPHIVHSWLFYPNLIARTTRVLCPPHRLITAIRSDYSPKQIMAENLCCWLSDFRVVNYKTISFHPHVLVQNGIALQGFPSEKKDYTSTNRSTFTLLMVARFDQTKDHQTLLKAVKEIIHLVTGSFQLLLIGEVSDPQVEQQVNTYIHDNNLHQFIQQRAPVLDIAEYYHRANITILPSKAEGFPNVILESLATGTPVIVSNAANKNELIQHGINGWVFPTGDSSALSECLLEAILTPQEKLKQMGDQGRKVAEKYSIGKMVEQYDKLYMRAVNES